MNLYQGRVVGVNFSPARENFDGLIEKFNRMPVDKIEFDIKLRHESDNPYDPNAVQVLFGNKGEELLKIGYIPKEQNRAVLAHGIENCEIEVLKLNKLDGEVKGIDILVKKK